MWEAEMDHRVTHRVGDIFSADLGGPHDAAVALPLMYGLADEQALPLLARIRAALRPGGLLLVPRPGRGLGYRSASLATPAVELFFQLDSGHASTTPEQFIGQLQLSGFSSPQAHHLPAAAELCLFVAEAM